MNLTRYVLLLIGIYKRNDTFLKHNLITINRIVNGVLSYIIDNENKINSSLEFLLFN